MVIHWIEQIKRDANHLFLVGDVFDYWFEYKYVVPKGYFRLFNQLASLVDGGTTVHFFAGNHDRWVRDYFEKDVGMCVYGGPEIIRLQDCTFFIAHGDGLTEGQFADKVLDYIMKNPLCRRLYSLLHPGIGIPLMKFCSRKSRKHQKDSALIPLKEDEQVLFCESMIKENPAIDYFIMGHRHRPCERLLSNQKTRYVNLGDWTHHFSYAVVEGGKLELKYFDHAVIGSSLTS